MAKFEPGLFTILQNVHVSTPKKMLLAQFELVKKRYRDANEILGDIVKVTPSSKVVGDLAQFMVQNKLTKEEVQERASELSFPNSVVEYLQVDLA